MIKRNDEFADASILEDLIATEDTAFSRTFAQALLGLKFQARQAKEIDRLLARNNAGTITDKQRARLDAYVRVGNFLSLLQAKARGSLTAKAGRR
jgi:hypothetical protein